MVSMVDMGRDEEPLDGADPVEPEEATLAFDEDGESLPWLESDDEEEDDGIDKSRILAFALGGLALLALLVGGIWALTRRDADPTLLAEGSTIPAPEQPYKEKPEDPGGKTFAGTGDTSFAVGEGQTREGKLALPDAAPPPAAPAKETKAEPAAAAPAPAPAPASNGVAVQVGAYSTKERAEAGWSQLATRHEALKGVSHRVVEGSADIGTVFRLQAISGDRASANQLCSTLRAQGAACQVK